MPNSWLSSVRPAPMAPADAKHQAGQQHEASLFHEQRGDRSRLRADRDPHRNLTFPLAHRVRDDAVDPDERQHRREPVDHLGDVPSMQDRGRAIGTWSGLAGVATALGPFLGGWLVDVVSWRLSSS